MTQDWIDTLARRQLRDYRAREPGTYFGEHAVPMSLHDAYRVSIRLSELRGDEGEARAGYKVGCTSPEILKAFGIRGPVFGFLYRNEIAPCGTRLSAGAFHNLAIEAEMAIRIGNDLGVDCVFPIIELHNLAFRAETKTLQELVANNCFNAGIVLPADIGTHRGDDCVSLGLRINGALIEEGHPWCFPGGPEASLAWLANERAKHGLPLQPGDIVLAGTNLGIHAVHPGDAIEVLLNDEPRVSSDVGS